jgi:thymidylate kinase
LAKNQELHLEEYTKLFKTDSELLHSLFDLLEIKEMRFLVLRNHQGLPESNNARDVDILVSPQTEPKSINAIVGELSKRFKANIIWINELDYLSGFVIARQLEDGTITYLKLDFFYGLKWRGLEFVDADEVLSSRVKIKNYYIPDPGHEAVVHLLNGVLYSKFIKDKYIPIIINGCDNYSDTFMSLINSSGIDSLKHKIKVVISGLKTEGVANNILAFRKALITRMIMHHASPRSVKGFWQSVITELVTRRRMGYLISFSGPDGSGKSTIMKYVLEFFSLPGITKQVVPHHFLPEGIPPLHRLVKVNKKLSKQDYTNPYSEKPVGRLSSLVRFCYYTVAFLVANLRYISPQKKRNEVVIFDRYYPDLIADPTRARLSISQSVISRIFSLVAAVPDVALVFIASPETLISRKGELTEQKAKQLVKDYTSICINSEFTLIENDGSLEDGKRKCFFEVFKKLHTENSRKLNV